ncbi:MAG: hypothetical protein NTW23_04220 [Rhodoluna sp.]|nr:hypothetical protein [Rhodoluna sp.]
MMEPTPTRLRNGRVAVLLSAPDAKRIKNELKNKAKKGVLKLNAMTGFESDQPKSKLRTVILPALAIFMCLLFFVPKEQSAATQVVKQIPKEKQEIACASPIPSGAQVLGKLEKFGLIYIQDHRYKIASFQRLGGLAQVKLKRVCDKTYLRLDLWSDGAQLKVEKVY